MMQIALRMSPYFRFETKSKLGFLNSDLSETVFNALHSISPSSVQRVATREQNIPAIMPVMITSAKPLIMSVPKK